MDTKHVVILGAGFSRAVSSLMPLSDELGTRSVELLDKQGRLHTSRLEFGRELTFETWLSLLSDDQPQLSEAANRQNAALYARLRDTLAALLLEAQSTVLESAAPEWLYWLVSALHRERATVMTFNYDKVLEAAVEGHMLWDPINRRLVDSGDALWNLPPLPNAGARLFGPRCETFRLLKLHGSLDWWAVPGDTSGATLVREEPRGTFESPSEMTDEERQQQLPGRERFIIPPLSTKNTYYRNPLTRELWQQAYRALQTATRISIVGYSLPPADSVMSNMLRLAIADREVAVDLVNPNPDDIVLRLVGFGVQPRQLRIASAGTCVEDFASGLCNEATSALADELRNGLLQHAPDASIRVACGDPSSFGIPVSRVEMLESTTLALIIEDGLSARDITAVPYNADGTPRNRLFATAEDLALMLGDCTRVVALDATGIHTLVSARHEGETVGANARWLTFIPADRGPMQALDRS
jgi:hypothetical protein